MDKPLTLSVADAVLVQATTEFLNGYEAGVSAACASAREHMMRLMRNRELPPPNPPQERQDG